MITLKRTAAVLTLLAATTHTVAQDLVFDTDDFSAWSHPAGLVNVTDDGVSVKRFGTTFNAVADIDDHSSITIGNFGTRVVRAAGNVRHIFFGHAHRPISGHWNGISFSTLYGTSHQTRLDLVTPDYVAYTAETPAYAVVLVDEARLVVHTCHFLEDDTDIKGT